MGKNPFGEKKQIAIITYYYDTALVKIQFSFKSYSIQTEPVCILMHNGFAY